MKAIYNDNSILINLNELVTIRAKILTQYEDYSNAISTGEYLDENDVDRIAVKLRETLTWDTLYGICLLYTSPSPRDGLLSRMPSSA